MTKFSECMYCGEEPEILVDDLISRPVGTNDWDPEVLYRLKRCPCGGLEVVTVARQRLPEKVRIPDVQRWANLLRATEEFLTTYAGPHPTGIVGRMQEAVISLKEVMQGEEPS